MINKKITTSLLTLLFLFTLTSLSSDAFARHNSNVRPGWGFGSTNHVHTGPPGQSVRITQTNNATVSNSVNVSSNTGGNRANRNTGGNVDITTGNSSIFVRIANLLNFNIIRFFEG